MKVSGRGPGLAACSEKTRTENDPTANRVHHEGQEMSTITEFAHHPMVRSIRTGAVVLAAGVMTGSVLYGLSIVVSTWA